MHTYAVPVAFNNYLHEPQTGGITIQFQVVFPTCCHRVDQISFACALLHV